MSLLPTISVKLSVLSDVCVKAMVIESVSGVTDGASAAVVDSKSATNIFTINPSSKQDV